MDSFLPKEKTKRQKGFKKKPQTLKGFFSSSLPQSAGKLVCGDLGEECFESLIAELKMLLLWNTVYILHISFILSVLEEVLTLTLEYLAELRQEVGGKPEFDS